MVRDAGGLRTSESGACCVVGGCLHTVHGGNPAPPEVLKVPGVTIV